MEGRALPPPDYKMQIIIIGDSGVGKTSFMDRFTEGAHRLAYSATVGIDFKVRRLDIDNKTVKMQIWDTAGQEKFNSITTAYYRQARAAIVMYDVTRPATFQNLRKWFTLIDTHARTDVTKILVGNKTDQKDERVVTIEQGRRAAEEFGAEFFESSAKSDSNVYSLIINRNHHLRKHSPQRFLQRMRWHISEDCCLDGSLTRACAQNDSASLSK